MKIKKKDQLIVFIVHEAFPDIEAFAHYPKNQLSKILFSIYH